MNYLNNYKINPIIYFTDFQLFTHEFIKIF